jgi:hypothetical protein
MASVKQFTFTCLLPSLIKNSKQLLSIPNDDSILLILYGVLTLSGLMYSRLSYFSFKYTYMASSLLLSAAIEASFLFNSPVISLVLLILATGGI